MHKEGKCEFCGADLRENLRQFYPTWTIYEPCWDAEGGFLDFTWIEECSNDSAKIEWRCGRCNAELNISEEEVIELLSERKEEPNVND